MNLRIAADEMIENASFEMSHLFSLGFPATFKNGRKGEVCLRFQKSSRPVQDEILSEAKETEDTIEFRVIKPVSIGFVVAVELTEDATPGSTKRIEQLRKYYELEEQSENPRSASVIDDSEFARDLIQAVLDFPQSAKQTPLVEFIRSEIQAAHNSGTLYEVE
jgi:hypothetical protein